MTNQYQQRVGSAYLKSLQKTDSKNSSTTGQAGSALGKDAFLQLLVTQMKNQNPLDPQDNGEFVAQLAQFSSLEGIQSLNDSVNGILTGIGSSQALQASSLVGRSVIVQTDKAVVDTTRASTARSWCRRASAMARSASRTRTATWSRPSSWVRRRPAPPTSSGMAPTRRAKSPRHLHLHGQTTVDGKAKTLSTLLPATVNSVSFQNGGEMMLNLAGMGSVGSPKSQASVSKPLIGTRSESCLSISALAVSMQPTNSERYRQQHCQRRHHRLQIVARRVRRPVLAVHPRYLRRQDQVGTA
jgi:flagellar basal-body rod modification protein FlgD